VSDPALGLTMLGLIVVAIMMGFPTAFTLMGLGMVFGYIAFWTPAGHWYDNRVFDLIVQRTYGVMTNDTLLSVPLFVFMGYIMERAALVDRMFHAVQLAFRRVPASLAVTTLLVCAFWGIASGIVGAVVVLMGVIALRPMLNAGYDVRLASGCITAGGTLGILIPPSVMLIVYAAVAGQSIVKLYAAAMLPGFFLTFLYLVYILGWAIIDPKIAPKLSPDQYRVAVPEYLQRLERGPARRIVPGLVAALFRPALVRASGGFGIIVKNVFALAVPLMLTFGTFGALLAIAVIVIAIGLALAAWIALLHLLLRLIALVPAIIATLVILTLIALLIAVAAVLIAEIVAEIVLLTGALLLEARAILIQDAEIVIRELKIIFGADAVALHLRVARQILVFLKKLGGIAARPIVETIATIGTTRLTVTRLLAPTAAPATVLTVVHQLGLILVTGGNVHHSKSGLPRRSFRTTLVREYTAQSLPRYDSRGAQNHARLPEPHCPDALAAT